MAVLCLFVCLSVPNPKSRMEKHSKLIIGRKEARDTGDSRPRLEVERSKVKVIKSCRQSVSQSINQSINQSIYSFKEQDKKAHGH